MTCQWPSHDGFTGSLSDTDVRQLNLRSVLGWGSTRELQVLLALVWIPRTVSKTATHFWLQGAGLFGWFITEAPALLTNRALQLVIYCLNKPRQFGLFCHFLWILTGCCRPHQIVVNCQSLLMLFDVRGRVVTDMFNMAWPLARNCNLTASEQIFRCISWKPPFLSLSSKSSPEKPLDLV